jgi:hypothetical protein
MKSMLSGAQALKVWTFKNTIKEKRATPAQPANFKKNSRESRGRQKELLSTKLHNS